MKVVGFYESSISNGEGIRVVVFVPGCLHNCEGCHNYEYKNFNLGEDMSVEKIIRKVSNPLIDGLTVSGGDPLQFKREGLLEVLKRVKDLGKSIWMYTGYRYEQVKDREEMKYIDVLVDGPYIENLRSDLKYRGSSNQRLIDVKLSLEKGEEIEWNV